LIPICIIFLYRYLIQSAQASIVGFRAGQAEVVAVTYELPGFTYQVH